MKEVKKGMLFLLILCANTLFAQEFTATIDKEQIKIGEQCTITLELENTLGYNSIQFPELRDTIIKFVEIIQVGNIDTTFDEEDVTVQYFKQEIKVTSWDSGFYAIKPFELILNGDTLRTEALLLEVNSVNITPEEDIKDIKDIMEVPFSLSDWMIANRVILLSILGILLLMLLAYYFYKRWKSREVLEEIRVPKEEADIVAIRKLEELNTKQLWQNGEVKSYYSELSFIVREYLENRYLFMALELSTEEILMQLPQLELEEVEKKKLHKILSLSDMAKFAKQKPLASENEEALRFAFEFVEETKLVITDEVNEKEEDSKE